MEVLVPVPPPSPSQLSPNHDSFKVEVTAPAGRLGLIVTNNNSIDDSKSFVTVKYLSKNSPMKEKILRNDIILAVNGVTLIEAKHAKYVLQKAMHQEKHLTIFRYFGKGANEENERDGLVAHASDKIDQKEKNDDGQEDRYRFQAPPPRADNKVERLDERLMETTDPSKSETILSSLDSRLSNKANFNMNASNCLSKLPDIEDGDHRIFEKKIKVPAQQQQDKKSFKEGVDASSNGHNQTEYFSEPGAFAIDIPVIENMQPTIPQVTTYEEHYSHYTFSDALHTTPAVSADLVPNQKEENKSSGKVNRAHTSKRMCIAFVALLLLAGSIAMGVLLSQKNENSGETCVRLFMNTGDFANGISWRIYDLASDTTVAYGDGYESNAEVEYESCFPNSGCYEFTIFDSFGDGFNGLGQYILTVDGSVIDQYSGNFGNEREILISPNQNCEILYPSSPAPTQAPIQVQTCVRLWLNTGDFANEISWRIYDRASDTQVAYGGGYESNAEVEYESCLPNNGCYEFTIYDAYGDGFNGPGRYFLTVNGNVVDQYSGNFGYEREIQISPNQNCEILFPSQAPIQVETCFRLFMNTGVYANEISWRIYDLASDTIVAYGDGYESNAEVEYESCFPNSGCYEFTIFDSFGDGFNGPGQYILTANGNVVDQYSGNFGNERVIQISPRQNCEILYPSSPAPTQAPIQVQTCIDLFMNTGVYANEISWRIYDLASDTTVVYGDGYENNAEVVYESCLPNNGCYELSIFDSYGDGFNGSGQYILTVNGNVVDQYSGNFGYERKILISPNQNCEILYPSSPAPTQAPTQVQTCISLFMNAGVYANEISWRIYDLASDTIVVYGDGYENNAEVVYESCLLSSGCYEFTIFDSFGDGFNGPGQYILTVNGNVVDQYSENFGYEREILISPNQNCEILFPSQAPISQAPIFDV